MSAEREAYARSLVDAVPWYRPFYRRRLRRQLWWAYR